MIVGWDGGVSMYGALSGISKSRRLCSRMARLRDLLSVGAFSLALQLKLFKIDRILSEVFKNPAPPFKSLLSSWLLSIVGAQLDNSKVFQVNQPPLVPIDCFKNQSTWILQKKSLIFKLIFIHFRNLLGNFSFLPILNITGKIKELVTSLPFHFGYD